MATSLAARRPAGPRRVPRRHRHAHRRWVASRTGSGTSSSSYGLQVFHYPAAQFPHGTANELQLSLDRSFLATLADAGHGTVVLHNSDPDLAAITTGDYLAFNVYGVRAFVMRCDSFQKISVDPNEDASYTTTWSGLGHLGILKKGVVGPPGGTGRSPIVDDIVYDYTHPDYDDSGWGSAHQIITTAAAAVANSWTTSASWTQADSSATMPAGSPTYIIWASDGTTTSAAEGDCYFRSTFTTTFDGLHEVIFAADNAIEVYIDGKLIGSGQLSRDALVAYTFRNQELISLSAGTHTIAIRGTNYPAFGGQNPAGVACQVYVPGFPPSLLWETTSATKIKAYPSETPGMTPGTVIRLFLAEQQAAGRFTQITLGFTDTHDSAGVSWPTFATIATRVGTDCLTFLKEIMATYADVEMDPNGWTLNAWVWGTRGSSSGVTLESPTNTSDPTTGNLVSLQQKGEDTSADELLIRWQGGWSADGSGTSQAFLELGPQTTAAEIARVAARVLAIYDNPREEIAAQYEPRNSTEVPWVNTSLIVGSTLTVPDSTGTPVSERVYELGVSQSQQEERVLVTVTAKDVILEEQERFVNALKA